MHSKSPEQVEFVQDWLADIPADVSSVERAEQEAQAIEFVQQLEDKQTRRLAIDALTAAVKAPSEALDELVYGARAAMEAPASKVPRLGERLLEGKNSALIIRAGQYEDFGREILEPLQALGGFSEVVEEKFPHPTNGLGHSRIHLDNFADETGAHFRYGLTISRTDRGSVLFIAGLASDAVYGWPKLYYEHVHKALNDSNRVQGLEDRATDRIAPRGVGYKEWEQPGRGIHGQFMATTLSEGDIAIWPQGGPGAELPAWHGFVQIGHQNNSHFEPRQSTSYHLSK